MTRWAIAMAVSLTAAGLAPAAVQTRARIIRDDRALFAAIWMEDPDPRQLRAPLVERDQVTAEQDLVQLEVDAVGVVALDQVGAEAPIPQNQAETFAFGFIAGAADDGSRRFDRVDPRG